jgi:hypothetical protein
VSGWGVQIENLERLLKKLQPQEMLGQPMRRFFDRSGESVLNFGKLRAPVDQGRMRSSLSRGAIGNIWRMDESISPRHLHVGTNVQNRGVSYPAVLEAGEDNKGRVFHYRGGGARGKKARGKPTKGWFSGALKDARTSIKRYLGQMGNEIKEAFGRR